MTIFKGLIVALGAASIGVAVAPAVAQDIHHDNNAYHRNNHDMHNMHRGNGWHQPHRRCHTEWRHHRRVTRCS